MPSLPNAAQPPVPGAGTDSSRGRSRSWAALCAVLLGLVLVYGAGLAQMEAIHNGAHDARHAAGFPCH